MGPFPQLTQMTLAAAGMVRFYDTRFGTQLKAREAFGTTLYNGSLAWILLVICPNESAGVEAEQSCHQLAFRVVDLASLLEQIEEAGGNIETPLKDSMTSTILRDPDGNTIEVTQA